METETTTPAETPHNAVIMRFLTVGGATVELRGKTFRTLYTWKGRPYIGDESRQVDGFAWACRGCGVVGSPDGFSDGGHYLPDEHGKARDHANAHATACRAMPQPTA